MKAINKALVHAISSEFQLGSHNFRAPIEYVNIKRPALAERFLVDEAKLPNVISIEIEGDLESTARSFVISCSNEDGILSPDYLESRFDKRRLDFELPLDSPWNEVLKSGTELTIHLGYKENYVKMLTGTIDEVSISADGRTITLTGRSEYAKTLKNTVTPAVTDKYLINDTNMNIGSAIKKFLDNAGVKNEIDQHIKEPYSGEEFTIGTKCGLRGEYANDLIQEMAHQTYYALIENAHGVVKSKLLPQFDKKVGKAVAAFDDYIDLTASELVYDASDVYDRILVTCTHNKYQIVDGKKKSVSVTEKSRFKSAQIRKEILRTNSRELTIDNSWSTTKSKRKYVAKAKFTEMLLNWQSMTIGLPAHLGLELLDIVTVRERVTQVSKRMYVTGIRTTFSVEGLTQIVKLSDHTKFKTDFDEVEIPEPDFELSTEQAQLVLYVYDYNVEDIDRLNIYFNGDRLANHLFITNKGYNFTLNLNKGVNTLKFIGITAGRGRTCSCRFKIKNTSGTVIYDTNDLPSIDFPRQNILSEKTGYYIPSKRPSTVWRVNRI